jgi:hypothetical protein|tara:strand:+ start:3328 stop:3522 length:195 start_codon:yes stop_codon:yes gene_type:complete
MKNWILMQTIKKALGSRKFLYTVVGVVVQLLSDNWGIDAATSQNILYGIIALVLGQGWADASKK